MSTRPAPNPLSSMGDTELLDFVRAKEIQRRQAYAEELRAIAEIERGRRFSAPWPRCRRSPRPSTTTA